ncbi:MAG: RidA family protein [Acidimicrobiales bacterium]
MIEHPEAPDPVSDLPYSNLVVAGDLVVVASQVPFDETGHLVGSRFSDQAHQVFKNLDRVLGLAGCTRADLLRVNGFLARAELFDEYNEIYREYFSPPYPARTTVACTLLVPGMLVQVDALARKP